MQGLSIAPKISKNGTINYTNLKYLILPDSAMGSSAVLSAYEKGVKIISVKNKTVLNVTPDKLKIKPYKCFRDYKECLDFILT